MTLFSVKDFTLYRLFLRAVSNRTRLGILDLLKTGARNVTQIAEELGYEQSRVSHSLRCLRTCGFIEVKQVGRNRVYSLNVATTIPLLEIMDMHVAEYGHRLEGCETLAQARMVLA